MAGEIFDLGKKLTLDLASKVPPLERFNAPATLRATLVLSMVCLAAAPLIAGDSYSFIRHTVSEAGGQGFSGAWLVRTGVVLASAAVFSLSLVASPRWPHAGTLGMRFYSLLLIGSAVFSDVPWNGGPGDETEAFLHTFFTFWAGFSFVVGVTAISLHRPPQADRPIIVFDWVVIASVILIPMIMMAVVPDGLLQRVIILLGYAWLMLEAGRAQPVAESVSGRGRST